MHYYHLNSNLIIFERYLLKFYNYINLYRIIIKLFELFFLRKVHFEIIWFLHILIYLYFLKKLHKKYLISIYYLLVFFPKPFFNFWFIFYPLKKHQVTLLRAPFVYKTTREQFKYTVREKSYNFKISVDSIFGIFFTYRLFIKAFNDFLNKEYYIKNYYLFSSK